MLQAVLFQGLKGLYIICFDTRDRHSRRSSDLVKFNFSKSGPLHQVST